MANTTYQCALHHWLLAKKWPGGFSAYISIHTQLTGRTETHIHPTHKLTHTHTHAHTNKHTYTQTQTHTHTHTHGINATVHAQTTIQRIDLFPRPAKKRFFKDFQAATMNGCCQMSLASVLYVFNLSARNCLPVSKAVCKDRIRVADRVMLAETKCDSPSEQAKLRSLLDDKFNQHISRLLINLPDFPSSLLWFVIYLTPMSLLVHIQGIKADLEASLLHFLWVFQNSLSWSLSHCKST